MSESAPGTDTPLPARGAPLLVTAELPPDILEWADAMRRAHFPPERNKLKAHVTLFHALPPSVEGELRDFLAELAKGSRPEAQVTGLMKLGGGTALNVSSPGMVELHERIAERMHGLLSRQDDRALRLHITIQNKVSGAEARALQDELAPRLEHRKFRFAGFGLYAFEDGRWRFIRTFPFRG